MTAPVEVLSSPRLKLRQLSIQDAAFILQLLNEKPFLENIGDRGVRTLADAKTYLTNGPIASYEKFGFGLYGVERKESAELIGICGVLKREYLDDARSEDHQKPSESGAGSDLRRSVFAGCVDEHSGVV